MRSSSSESDRTYDSSWSENSSDRRRLSSSAARRRSCSERSNRCRRRHSTPPTPSIDRKSTRLNSSHITISYAVFCLKKKKNRKGISVKTKKIYRNKTIHMKKKEK